MANHKDRSSEANQANLSTPQAARRKLKPYRPNPDSFGRMTESFARFMGTPQFLLWMTLFCGIWLGWNTFAPESMQFDPRALNYTLLTLILSLQASYAAPLLLLAQNRQDDRDRVVASQDRKRDQQNLEETQYLTREIASLRIAMREVATRDYVRSELRAILEELQEIQEKQVSREGIDGMADAEKQEPKKMKVMDVVSDVPDSNVVSKG